MTINKEELSRKYFDDIKVKHLKEFHDVKTPKGNLISGVICKKANRFLGSMVITEIKTNDESWGILRAEQFVQAMPKINYYDYHHEMFVEDTEVHYPAYEKLDGSCLILFGLYTPDGKLLEVVPKTRGIPVADSHIVEMYNELDHCNIECFFEVHGESNPTLLFELYGTLNKHSIFYPKTRIDIKLIGATSEKEFLNDYELDWLRDQYDFKRPDKVFILVFYRGSWKIRLLPPGIYAYYLYEGLTEEERDELVNAEYPTQLDAIQGVKDRITKINKSFSEKNGHALLEGVVIDTLSSISQHFMYLKVKSAEIEETFRTENGIPRKFILKEVRKYFDEYGSKAKEIYKDNPDHVIEYVNRNLLEEFDVVAVEMKRTQKRILNVFLDILDAKEPPKGLQEVCHKIVEEYPNSEISDLMRIFAQEYPEKKRHASMAYSIFESII